MTAKKKKKPVNNPALAGKFTKAFKAYSNQRKTPPGGVDVPTDDPATEARERKRGVKT